MDSSAPAPPDDVRGRDPRDLPVHVVAERLKERIYAQLSVVAVTIGLALAGSASTGAAASAVAATAVGLWLATLAADQQAHAAVYGHLAWGHDLRMLLVRTSPLLTAAIGPLILIGAAALEVMSLVGALYVAVAVDLALMFLWGLGLGRRMGTGWIAALVSGMVNLVIGGVVVGVKLVAGH